MSKDFSPPPGGKPPRMRPARATFGALLARYRQDAGLSQTLLAKLVGMHGSYISRMERDLKDRPTRELVLAIAKELGIGRTKVDRLLFAAGFVSTRVLQLGIDDPTLQAVIKTLTDSEDLPEEMIDDFRECVERQAEILAGVRDLLRAKNAAGGVPAETPAPPPKRRATGR